MDNENLVMIPPEKMKMEQEEEEEEEEFIDNRIKSSSTSLENKPSTLNDYGKLLLNASKSGEIDTVIKLINCNAPFISDWIGYTALHFAAQNGHLDTVEILIKQGIGKDTSTKIGRTALHLAAQQGIVDVVKFLLEFECDVDAQDMLKMTPLHWAVQRGHRFVVQVILEHGADISMKDQFLRTPIDIAYKSGRDDLVPLLESYKGKSKPKINFIRYPVIRSRKRSHPRPVIMKQEYNLKSIDQNYGQISEISSPTFGDETTKVDNGQPVFYTKIRNRENIINENPVQMPMIPSNQNYGNQINGNAVPVINPVLSSKLIFLENERKHLLETVKYLKNELENCHKIIFSKNIEIEHLKKVKLNKT